MEVEGLSVAAEVHLADAELAVELLARVPPVGGDPVLEVCDPNIDAPVVALARRAEPQLLAKQKGASVEGRALGVLEKQPARLRPRPVGALGDVEARDAVEELLRAAALAGGV